MSTLPTFLNAPIENTSTATGVPFVFNTCLAIMGHGGAETTVADFEPRWRTLGLPMLAFVPQDDLWPGTADKVFRQGKSAHKGTEVFHRFLRMCWTLLNTDYELFLMMEYDTVNLTDKLPVYDPKCVSAGLMHAVGPTAPFGNYMIAMSPWIVTRPMLAALIEALQMQLHNPIHELWVDGLLDRWLAVSIISGRLPYKWITDCMPWPMINPQIHDDIRSGKFTWIHGWKNKEPFKDTWPTT